MKNTAAFSSGKLGIYTRYSERGASSRLRYYLYRQALTEQGFLPQYHPFFTDGYLQKLYSGKGKSKTDALAALLKRFCRLPFLEKELLIEYELSPFLPAGVELFFIGKRKYVLNFDDLVWEKYKNISLLSGKFDKLIANAAGVIAANHLLYDRIKQLNPRVILIPTVVDLDHYRRREVRDTAVLRAAWIGTPVTFQECFLPLEKTLRTVCGEIPLEILVIASDRIAPLPGINMTSVNWSEETEVALLSSCDIGIMPLADNDFSRGKSAYKLIQYAAAGLPSVASPVGENKHFIRQGENGFCADTPEQWLSAVQYLSVTENRQKMSGAIYQTAYAYSLQKYAPVLADFLKACFSC